MSFNTPIIFIVYKRLETTKKVFDKIKAIRPSKLYLVADGPKTPQEETLTSSVRSYLEEYIDWECNITKIYSHTNLGCAKRVQTGLDEVFFKEEMAIILEDDTIPDISFFKFCEELLHLYEYDHRVCHISGCNEHPNIINTNDSYCFSALINIWGWATWRRAWQNYDLKMSAWDKEDKSNFLKYWCNSKREINGKRKMFDLHCNNPAPWTWDYQWVYSCWKNKGLAIIPTVNLVSNIGIGPDATNTSSIKAVPIYPKKLQSVNFPLTHQKIERNKSLEKAYTRASKVSLFRKLKNKIKSVLFKKFVNRKYI